MPKQPTPKQRQLAEKTILNLSSDKPKSQRDLLREVGYSENSAIASTTITKSVGFLKALEDAGVTDDKLSRVMNEGLDALKNGEADHAIRHKYLETAVKVKGIIKPDDTPGGTTYNTFIQQNNINPNAVDAKALVENTLEMLMNQTREE